MPCDLGYRSVSEVRIEAPVRKTITARTSAPELDAELLERLGQEDPTFLAWLGELDSLPLLEKALERALAAFPGTSRAELRIENGALVGSAQVSGPRSEQAARAVFERIGRRWQIEILRVVAEILDFDVSVEVTSENAIIVEGEKNSSSAVKEFLRVTADPESGINELRFEHFKSSAELEAEEDRFLALAERLGVRIVIVRRRRGGQDIPTGAVHTHKHKKGKS